MLLWLFSAKEREGLSLPSYYQSRAEGLITEGAGCAANVGFSAVKSMENYHLCCKPKAVSQQCEKQEERAGTCTKLSLGLCKVSYHNRSHSELAKWHMHGETTQFHDILWGLCSDFYKDSTKYQATNGDMNSSSERTMGNPVSLSMAWDGGWLTLRCQTLSLQISQGFKLQSHLPLAEEPLAHLWVFIGLVLLSIR